MKIQGTPAQGNISISNLKVTTPDIINLSMPISGTEYTASLPANTARFFLRSRTDSILQLSYTSGETGTKYLTIYPGETYVEERIDKVSLDLYLQSSKSAETVEIVSWS